MYGINTIKKINERASVHENFDNDLRWNYNVAEGVATVFTHPDTKVADMIKLKRRIVALHGLQTRFDIKLPN